MTSYARMARILRWLDEHASSQPTLAEMASLAGLGESHFHREFVRWTGVTPKDFVQCLTLADARERLARGDSVFDAATGSGLSGPGRLHDLCVSLVAATPGELKAAGEGMEIRWGLAESPFGLCLAGWSGRGICRFEFVESEPTAMEVVSLWPKATWIRDDGMAKCLLGPVFSKDAAGGTGALRAWVKGTDFQLRVWRALLSIPEGSLATYGAIARTIGKDGAARAVGAAVGANPVALLIPCHRVIRETGAISGYRWGVGRKRALLAWEASPRA